MNENLRSNENAKARKTRNNSIQTIKICTLNLAKLIANKFKTNIAERTNETTNRPKNPLSFGFPILP